MTATAHAATSVAASSDLDAVASAWAEPAAAHSSTQSSPVARSAKEEKANVPGVKAPVADRYAAQSDLPAKASTPAEVLTDTRTKDLAAKDDAKSTKESKTVKTAEKTDVKLASHTDTKTANKELAPTLADPAPEASLARGQEPKDDTSGTTPAKNNSGDINDGLGAIPTSSPQTKEPKQLASPDQPSSINDAAQRAKQAFGNSPSSSIPTTAKVDRYSDAAPPAPESTSASNSVTVNPFGSKPGSVPSAAPKNGMIEPMRPSSSDIGGALRDSQQPSQGLRPLNMNQSTRTATRDTSPKDYNPQPLPASSTPSANIGAMPSSISPSPTLPSSISPTREASPNTDSTPNQPIAGTDGAGKPGEKALEGPQQSTLVMQKFAPGEIQVGKPAKFVLQVRNAGSQAADNVTIQDDVPQGTQLISTSPNAAVEGSRLVWTLGKLSAGEDRTVEMQVMPKAEGDLGSVATVTYSAQASVKTKCTMPQLAIRMTAPSEVMIGNQQHVKIEIRNPGSGDATKVMLFENIPPNVKHAAGPALEFEIGTLRAGETREIDLVLTAEKAGKVINTLTARAEGSLQVQQQVEFEVIAPALSVAVQGPEKRYLERPATYEVSVQNPGTAPAHDVQIVTKLPKGMRFIKANNMGEYDAASHAVYWSLAELPKGERGTVELVAMPIETGTQTLQVESHAQQGLTDKTQREVLVEGLAAIKFEVKALDDPIEVGRETGYEIRVLNQGTKAAANVQVTAELPPGLKFISAEGETQHKFDQGRVYFEPLQQLAPKADTVYRLRAQGTQPGDQRIVVEVKTDDLQQPIRREESTRVFGDQ
jgi:uncharacterized repeat protein (TIGR01451 family)